VSTVGIYGGVPAVTENEEKKRTTRVLRRIYGNAERYREGTDLICIQNSTGGRHERALVVITGILSYIIPKRPN
jgi:hypothetical protein